MAGSLCTTKFEELALLTQVIRNKKKLSRPNESKTIVKVKFDNQTESHSNEEDSRTSAHLRTQKRKAEIYKYRLEGIEVDKFEERTRKAKERLIKRMVNDNRFKTASLDRLFGTSRNKNRNKLAE